MFLSASCCVVVRTQQEGRHPNKVLYSGALDMLVEPDQASRALSPPLRAHVLACARARPQLGDWRLWCRDRTLRSVPSTPTLHSSVTPPTLAVTLPTHPAMAGGLRLRRVLDGPCEHAACPLRRALDLTLHAPAG